MSFSISILEKRKQNQSKAYIIDISYGGGIMQSKILFFDVDGTLLDTARGIPDIPQGALYQLKRIQEQGHKIFISSGRPKAMINQYLLNVGFDGYILANGGYVEIDGQSIYEDRMDYKLCVKTVQMLEDLRCDYMLETADAIYIDPSYHELYDFFSQAGMKEMFQLDFDKDEVLKRTIKIEANVLNKDKAKIENYIQDKFGSVIHHDEHGSENAFEFFSPTISKAVGIQKVLDYYHVSRQQTYAFGDGLNDMEMIEYCEVGVAMGNAVEALKQKADLVCCAIENQGLERILKILFPDEV